MMDQNEIKHKQEDEKQLYKKLLKRKKQNIILNVISVILALGGIIWACDFFIRYYRYEITNDANIEQYISPINSRVAGYITEVRFREHQWVEEGDTILVIDDREYRIKQMDAEAALLSALSSRSVQSSSIAATIANIGASGANMQEVKTRLWKLEQNVDRYSTLLETKSVSRQQYEQAKSEYDAQKAHYDALVKQKESIKSVSTEAQRKQLGIEANILRQQAALDMAMLNLSYTVITAPYSGHLGRRTLEIGQFVQIGQTITTVVKNDEKWIVANYREMQIENIYIGQEIKIRVDAMQDEVFKGKVTAISEATGSKYSLLPTDNSAGNFVKVQQRIPVRIDFVDISDEDIQKMRAGMMVITEARKQ